jgi:hypothetical protein
MTLTDKQLHEIAYRGGVEITPDMLRSLSTPDMFIKLPMDEQVLADQYFKQSMTSFSPETGLSFGTAELTFRTHEESEAALRAIFVVSRLVDPSPEIRRWKNMAYAPQKIKKPSILKPRSAHHVPLPPTQQNIQTLLQKTKKGWFRDVPVDLCLKIDTVAILRYGEGYMWVVGPAHYSHVRRIDGRFSQVRKGNEHDTFHQEGEVAHNERIKSVGEFMMDSEGCAVTKGSRWFVADQRLLDFVATYHVTH